jgi:MFS family permease
MNAPIATYDRRNVRLVYVFGFLMEFALWAGIWIKYLIETRGFELRWLLAMDLPFWLIVATLQAPTGALADHIGRKRVLAISGVLFSLTVLGFGLAQNYWMLFFDYVLWAFAQSMRSGADSALVFDSLKHAGKESTFRRVAGRSFAVQLTSQFVAIALGGVLAAWGGLALIVQVSAIPPLLAAGIAMMMHEPEIAREERRYWKGLNEGLGFAWRTAQVRYTLFIGAVLLTGTFGPVVLVQPFLIHREVATGLFGIYQAPLRLTMVVAALLSAWVGRRTETGRLISMACVAIIACYVGLGLFDANISFAFFALPSLVAGLTRPVVEGHLHDRIPSEQRATVISTMQLVFSLQVAFFEPALGFFADGISLTAAFLFAAGYFVVLMPPLLLLWRRAHGLLPVTSPSSAVAEST